MRASGFQLILLSVTFIAAGAACSSGPGGQTSVSTQPTPGATPSNTATPGTTTLTKLSFDPYTNSDGQHETAMETNIVSHGSTLVAGYHIARLTTGGVTNIGWAVSNDGGATWNRGALPHTTTYAGGSLGYVTDPVVAYDAKHSTWMLTFVGSNPYGAYVSLSHDDGRNWSDPVTIATNGQPDKNWTTCDTTPSSPRYGNCYTEYDDNSTNAVYMSTSTDGGATWGSPKTPVDGFAGIAGAPVVLPTGRVVVPIADSSFSELSAFRSDDGGASWSASEAISSMRSASLVTGLRADPNPTAVVDDTGRIFLVWTDCAFESGCSSNDLVMSTSTDGVSWSTPARVPGVTGANHLYPGIGADPASGKLGISFYTVSTSNQIDAYYISSTDHGATWSQPFHLAGPMNLSWISTTARGTMIGDYTGVAFLDGTAYPVFSVALAPGALPYNQGVYTWPQR